MLTRRWGTEVAIPLLTHLTAQDCVNTRSCHPLDFLCAACSVEHPGALGVCCLTRVLRGVLQGQVSGTAGKVLLLPTAECLGLCSLCFGSQPGARGRQQAEAQEVGPMPPMWESQAESPVPGFSLTQLWHFIVGTWGVKTADGSSFAPLSLSDNQN